MLIMLLLILAIVCFVLDAFKTPLKLTTTITLSSLGWAFALGAVLANLWK